MQSRPVFIALIVSCWSHSRNASFCNAAHQCLSLIACRPYMSTSLKPQFLMQLFPFIKKKKNQAHVETTDVTEVTTSKLEITLRAPEHFSVTGFTVLELLMTSKLSFRCAKMFHSFEDECFMSFVNIFDNFICFCRVYWPMFVLIFYVLSPIPTFISRRLSDDSESSNACRELAYFLTTGIVVSSFGLPIVLARTNTVSSLYLFTLFEYTAKKLSDPTKWA